MNGNETAEWVVAVAGFLIAIWGVLLGLVSHVASMRTGDLYPGDPIRALRLSIRWPYVLQYPLLLVGFGLIWLSGRL